MLSAMALTLDDALGGRLELTFTTSSLEAEQGVGLDDRDELPWHRAEGCAAIVRGLGSGPTVAIAGDTPAAFDVAARVADDVVLPPSDPAA